MALLPWEAVDSYTSQCWYKHLAGWMHYCSKAAPIIEIVESLLEIFPESPEHLAMDIVPLDEYADPDTWQGDWKEKRWTPLSRAIDRRLDPCVALFKAALTESLNRGRSMGSPVKVVSTSPNTKKMENDQTRYK